MLNLIWAAMLLAGLIYGACNGTLPEIGTGVMESAKDAVNLSLTMLAVMSVWTGMMRIAEEGGMLSGLVRLLRPVLRYLFPGLSKQDPAYTHIGTNFAANMLGLGWAATPAGLSAMKALKQRAGETKTATDDMCTFLVINTSSLQLIPMTIIAYRMQYGSADPYAILIPGLLATSASTLAAVVFCRLARKYL